MGLDKKYQFSQELYDLTGKKAGTRANATKWFWDYVKANDLQNPSNKREIICDETLYEVCGKKKITMFEVGKVLTPHLT
jgi:chromatin remodeling complex protein RSC6